MSNCATIGIQDVSELPIDNLESVPDYFITLRTFQDESTGDVKNVFTRTAGNKVLPNGNLDNVFALVSNNDALTIAPTQPTPCYVANEGTQNVVYPADGTHKAIFFAIGTYGPQTLCQNSGVLNILQGHNYIIGQQYYLATEGGVTTDASQTGQPLFVPISKYKLLLNIGA